MQQLEKERKKIKTLQMFYDLKKTKKTLDLKVKTFEKNKIKF